MSQLATAIEEMQKAGKKVVGCFPLYPPVELLHSLGLTPLILWDLKQEIENTAESDKHLQIYTCSVARCLTQFLLEGHTSRFDALLMYNACDTLRNLPEILTKGMRDLGYDIPFFKLHVPAVPAHQTNFSTYLKHRVWERIRDLEKYFDVHFSGEQFKRSVLLYNELRSLCRQVESLAVEGKLAFSEFDRLCSTGYHLTVETQIEQLQLLINRYKAEDRIDMGNGSVILSGILSPPVSIANAIEEAGLRIVGNDIATLSRSYGYIPWPTDDPAAYYADFYQNHIPCTTILPSSDQRIEMFIELVNKKKARGVIFIGEKYCEYEYFEFPYFERCLKENGIRVLQLECAIDDKENIGAIKTRIEAFAELLTTT